jgi:hypothetical protein
VRSRTALPRSRTIGRKPALRQDQRGEDAGRAEADDQRPFAVLGGGAADEAIAHVGRRLQVTVAGEAGERRRLVGKLYVDAVDEGERAVAARVVAAPEDAQRADVDRLDAEAGGDRRRQRGGGMVDRQADFADSQHGDGRWSR